jgi:hypothetical protein
VAGFAATLRFYAACWIFCTARFQAGLVHAARVRRFRRCPPQRTIQFTAAYNELRWR